MPFKNLFFGKGKFLGAKPGATKPGAAASFASTEPAAPAADRLVDPGCFSDAEAWIFCATMQARTPSWILARHNEVFRGPFDALPRYATAQWQGIWVPYVDDDKLQALLSEGRTMSSEVGYIPADGGDYLPFLRALRAITESGAPVEAIESDLRALLKQRGPKGTAYASFYTAAALIDQVIPLVTASMPVNGPVQVGLQLAGYRTLREIGNASDEQLLAINGLGPKALGAIRQFLSTTKLPMDAPRVLAPEFAA